MKKLILAFVLVLPVSMSASTWDTLDKIGTSVTLIEAALQAPPAVRAGISKVKAFTKKTAKVTAKTTKKVVKKL